MGHRFRCLPQSNQGSFVDRAHPCGNHVDYHRRTLAGQLPGWPRRARNRAFDKLISWSDNTDAGIRYFSGLGTYTKTIDAPANWFTSGAKHWIDLGDVKNLAEVTVNGKPVGVVWHAPYRVEVTSALKPSANEISIKVANAWVNRLIGDQQPNAEKITFTIIHPYKADSPLLPSGLLGPVVIIKTSNK